MHLLVLQSRFEVILKDHTDFLMDSCNKLSSCSLNSMEEIGTKMLLEIPQDLNRIL